MLLLQKGHKIGLIASSSPITPNLKKSLDKAIQLFRECGLVPVLGKYCLLGKNIPISPHQRAEDFNRFIENKEIKAIINLWGGYNSNDILNLINWDQLQNNKKLIIGASDFTTILNAVYARLKQPSYHWINAVWYGLNRYKKSENPFKKYFLEESVDNHLLSLSTPRVVREGKGKGILIGGNFESFERLIGTQFYPCSDNQDYILFLEDIDKQFLEIQAAFQHLRLVGFFEKCKGLILGYFNPASSEKNINLNLTVQSLAKEISHEYNFPIIYSPNIGHEVSNEVLPIGASVYINTLKTEYLKF